MEILYVRASLSLDREPKARGLSGEFSQFQCSSDGPSARAVVRYLEFYLDDFRSREICAAVLNTGGGNQNGMGYRVVSPEAKTARGSRKRGE